MGGNMGHPGSPYSPILGAGMLALQQEEARMVAWHMPLEGVITAGHWHGICSCHKLQWLVEIPVSTELSATRALGRYAFCQLGPRERTPATSHLLQLHGLIPWTSGMLHCKPT